MNFANVNSMGSRALAFEIWEKLYKNKTLSALGYNFESKSGGKELHATVGCKSIDFEPDYEGNVSVILKVTDTITDTVECKGFSCDFSMKPLVIYMEALGLASKQKRKQKRTVLTDESKKRDQAALERKKKLRGGSRSKIGPSQRIVQSYCRRRKATRG